MTLTGMLIRIGIVALVLTLIIGFGLKKKDNLLMSFVQTFVGSLFVFSGWVKAMDPLGTAYKMDQYFAEFSSTFEASWFSFIAPLFPWISNYSISFSVIMIVFEIVLGVMIVIGAKPKFTAWAFLLLVGFFTFLTGFTYLTGYVGEGSTFFDFSSWGEYKKTNMKVTDCGCFGDFIKLEPKVSFMKDVFLLLPAFYFLFRSKQMHQLFNTKIRNILIGATTAFILLYCLSNYVWDLPHTDFRPFKKNVDIAAQKQIEEDAMASVRITGWKLESLKEPGKVIELSNDVYMKEFQNYPKTDWKVIEQIKTEPAIEKSKISDFDISDLEGDDATDRLLADENHAIWIVSHKLKGKPFVEKIEVQDSVYKKEVVLNEKGDSVAYNDVLDVVLTKTKNITNYKWDKSFVDAFKEKINPLVTKAKEKNINTYYFTGGADAESLRKLKMEIGLDAEFFTADDILLKTIIRSNPGILIVKNGKILDKWHISKLPPFEEIAQKIGF